MCKFTPDGQEIRPRVGALGRREGKIASVTRLAGCGTGNALIVKNIVLEYAEDQKFLLSGFPHIGNKKRYRSH